MYHGGRAAGSLHVRVRVLAGHGGPVHRADRAGDPRRHAAGGDRGHAAGQAGDIPRGHGAGIGGVFAAAEKAQVKRGFSNSRTCEIGLTTHSGVPYQSLVYLINECTTPKKRTN